MKSSNSFRLAVCLVLLLWAGTAAAQLRDAENAEPRVRIPVADMALEGANGSESPLATQREQLLHELTAVLQLQPHQVLVVQRMLAAELLSVSVHQNPEPKTDVTTKMAQALCLQLTAAQLARLQQWETGRAEKQRSSMIASLQ